jgi:hypothetical protein
MEVKKLSSSLSLQPCIPSDAVSWVLPPGLSSSYFRFPVCSLPPQPSFSPIFSQPIESTSKSCLHPPKWPTGDPTCFLYCHPSSQANITHHLALATATYLPPFSLIEPSCTLHPGPNFANFTTLSCSKLSGTSKYLETSSALWPLSPAKVCCYLLL